MTAQSSIPLKWYVPFAQGDSSRVELPVTTADPTRASQTLGFPPLTMQPPESGGVPPQGEDFNGGMNQVARIAWWILNGGGFPYDSTFATNSNINGYPNGAVLQSADFRGNWISLADNNQANPDTGSGTAWVPGFQYGTTSLTGLTGGTVTPTPAQASKNSITLAGTLGSALTVVLPAWIKNWTITNNTTGAFVTIVKTAAGSGVTIPQNGAPTRVSGDGTNIVQAAENIATATLTNQATPFGQVVGVVGQGRGINSSLATAGGTATFAGQDIIVETSGGLRYCIASLSQAINLATSGAGGQTGTAVAASGFAAIYAAYNPSTGAATAFATDASAAAAAQIYGGVLSGTLVGFTATGLIGIIPTGSTTNQFAANWVLAGRVVAWIGGNIVTTSTFTGGPTLNSANALIPFNAVAFGGFIQESNTGGTVGGMSVTLSPINAAAGGWVFASSLPATTSVASSYRCLVAGGSPRQFYRTVTASGTVNHTITTDYYEF